VKSRRLSRLDPKSRLPSREPKRPSRPAKNRDRRLEFPDGDLDLDFPLIYRGAMGRGSSQLSALQNPPTLRSTTSKLFRVNMFRGNPSKKRRHTAGASSSSAPAPQDPTQLSPQHRARLEHIRDYSWHPMFRLDFGILTEFRWEDDVRAHIDSIGWGFLLQPPPTHVYPQAVLEFLASISYAEAPSMVPGLPPTKMVNYFMGGEYRTTTLDEFNVSIGFVRPEDVLTRGYREAICSRPASLTAAEMW
ncbi:unnamed protein product, partial [Sphenostylis stenocarpa]